MKYVCPMHPEISQANPGKCPKCGMQLVQKDGHVPEPAESYTPLIVIVLLILVTSVTIATKDYSVGIFSWSKLVEYFMIGFFLSFAGFKLMDLKGFAQGYSMYDLLAKKWFGYGYIYPFIELGFGLLMILGLWQKEVLIAEILVMSFSGIGVLLKMLKHEKFQCACLGTFLKVPLTKVTLVEDFGMAALALLIFLNLVQ